MAAEGLENLYARHHRLGQKMRQGLRDLGIRLLADESHASDTVTAAYIPAGYDGSTFFQRLSRDYGLIVASGQGPLKGKIFRVAHMGYVTDQDIEKALAALSDLLQPKS
jgi:aspartate aminotransferase-like enzyme